MGRSHSRKETDKSNITGWVLIEIGGFSLLLNLKYSTVSDVTSIDAMLEGINVRN